jgi:O-antigen ligase
VAAVPVIAVVLFGAVEDEHALPLETAALLLGAWALVARALRGDRPLPLAPVVLPVLLLAAIPALQLLPFPRGTAGLVSPGFERFGVGSLRTLSVYPHATAIALLRWLAYAAYLIAALEFLRRPGAVAAALGVVALLGIGEAVYGVANLLVGNHRLLWLPREVGFENATGTLVNRNHYAALLQLCLAALLARRWLSPRRAHDERGLTALYLAGATAIGLAAVLSHSRAGVLCLGAGLAVAAALAPRGAAGRNGRRTVGALALLVLLYSAYAGIGPVVERFAELPRGSTHVRTALWRDTLGVVRDFPLAGAGAGTFETVFPAYRHHLRDQATYSHAHQDYLQLAAEGGLVAVLLALLAAVRFGGVLRTALARATGRPRLALAALTGGLAAVLLHATLDFPLHIPGLTWLLLLLAAATLTLAGAAEAPYIPSIPSAPSFTHGTAWPRAGSGR